MSPSPGPSTKLVRLVLVVTGMLALGAKGREHFGTPGMLIGAFIGLLLGWLAGWWVTRTFLDF